MIVCIHWVVWNSSWLLSEADSITDNELCPCHLSGWVSRNWQHNFSHAHDSVSRVQVGSKLNVVILLILGLNVTIWMSKYESTIDRKIFFPRVLGDHIDWCDTIDRHFVVSWFLILNSEIWVGTIEEQKVISVAPLVFFHVPKLVNSH